METNRPYAISDQKTPRYEPPEPDVVGPEALFSFEGRIGRATFWKVCFLTLIAAFAVVFAAGMLVAVMEDTGVAPDGGAIVVAVVLWAVFLWIGFANQAKRFHDLDKSGWMVLLSFIPIVGLIVFIWVGASPGTDGPNRFGARPMRIRLSG